MQSYTYLAPANAIATVEDRLSLSTGYLYWERQEQFQDDKAPKRTSESETLLLLQQRRQQQAGRGPRKERKEIPNKEPTNWRDNQRALNEHYDHGMTRGLMHQNTC